MTDLKKTIRELDLLERCGVAITRLHRAGIEVKDMVIGQLAAAGNMTEIVAKEEEWKEREIKLKEEAIIKMIKSGALSDNQIADFQGVTTKEVSRIREKIKNGK